MGTVEQSSGIGRDAAASGAASVAASNLSAGAERPSFARAIFDALGDRLVSRIEDIQLFTETGCSYEEWCIWEAVSAFRGHHRAGAQGEPTGHASLGWKVQPRLAYASVGVTGSRETADLLVTDPIHGGRVLMELSVIHDRSRNEWIDKLDGDTEKLSRPLAPGIVRLQVILAASLESHLDVNPIWQQWLGMSKVWNRPTDFKRVMPLGVVGQLRLQGWVLPAPA